MTDRQDVRMNISDMTETDHVCVCVCVCVCV